MRTVNEIVGAVQEQGPATEEELRLTLLCLHYTMSLDNSDLDWDSASLIQFRSRARGQFERHFRMGKADPEVWLGDRWLPGTDENQRGREISRKVAEKALAEPVEGGGS